MTKSLRELRQEAGLTQAELAVRAGIRPNTISELELGHRNATVELLAAIARVLADRLDMPFDAVLCTVAVDAHRTLSNRKAAAS